MKKKVKPNPCPVCKAKYPGVEILNPYENDRAVRCGKCYFIGPIARQHDIAIRLWNEEYKGE